MLSFRSARVFVFVFVAVCGAVDAAKHAVPSVSNLANFPAVSADATPRQSSAKKAAKTGTGMIVGARPSAPDAHVVAEFLDEIRRVGTTRASAGESDGLSESLTIAAVDDRAQFLTEIRQCARATTNSLTA